jgi:hypothetical protein
MKETNNKYSKNVSILLTIVMMAFALSACVSSNFTPSEKTILTTAKTLEAAVIFRDMGLETAGDFYKQGLLSEKEKEEIIEIGNNLYDAILLTKETLRLYHMTGQGGKTLEERVALYQNLYGKFSDIVMPYLLKTLK